MIELIVGVVLGAVLTAIFSTKNFKEIINFKVGKVRCRLNNQRHLYKYFADLYNSDTGKIMPFHIENHTQKTAKHRKDTCSREW